VEDEHPREKKAGPNERILSVVKRIPRGRVATYGQVARLAGLSGQPRLTGYALSALPDGSSVPWHRVINAKGEISRRASGEGSEALQRARLESEGVEFDPEGCIDLRRFQWRPRKLSVLKE
jgi:methylated-DNA-protein-cysteine methyltransferase-like protein